VGGFGFAECDLGYRKVATKPCFRRRPAASDKFRKTLCDVSAFRNSRHPYENADIPNLREAKAEYAKL
jgi:hypothetical protein